VCACVLFVRVRARACVCVAKCVYEFQNFMIIVLTGYIAICYVTM